MTTVTRTKTAQEIFTRFQNNGFNPIEVTMNADGEKLRLDFTKIDENKDFEPENICVEVFQEQHIRAVGGLENIACWLRNYGRENPVSETPEHTGELTLQAIMGHTLVDFDRFEPTDSEGHEIRGFAEFNNEDFVVTLIGISEKSYIEQASEQILKELSHE